MFLAKLLERNPKLVEASLEFHAGGDIEPDSYVLDLDSFLENAHKIYVESNKRKILPFFMLKQLGRNPDLARMLCQMGYPGAVTVDFREAQVMRSHSIPIQNIGHLVQLPLKQVQPFVEYGVGAFTVYSEEMIAAINEAGKGIGKQQAILLRVVGEKDELYPGQEAGIPLARLAHLVEKILKKYPFIHIKGVTAFPCFLFDGDRKEIVPTENLYSLQKAAAILRDLGINIEWLDTPSANCVASIPLVERAGGNVIEPGHGFTGTTPLHAVQDAEEKPAILYLSEVSHNFDGRSYCFGGGYYRRSHLENALVGNRMGESARTTIEAPPLDSIDYHFVLGGKFAIGDPVVMAFRYQIFVTRSQLVVVQGIQKGKPEIVAKYSSLGQRLK